MIEIWLKKEGEREIEVHRKRVGIIGWKGVVTATEAESSDQDLENDFVNQHHLLREALTTRLKTETFIVLGAGVQAVKDDVHSDLLSQNIVACRTAVAAEAVIKAGAIEDL